MKLASASTLIAVLAVTSACAAGPATQEASTSAQQAPTAPATSSGAPLTSAAQKAADAANAARASLPRTAIPKTPHTPPTTTRPGTPGITRLPELTGIPGLSPAQAPRLPQTAQQPARTPATQAPAPGGSPAQPAPSAHETAPTPWKARPATYGVVVEKDQKITMSDGVVLRADVYRPAHGSKAAPGRFPVLLNQTPYNKTAAGQLLSAGGNYLVQRGYVLVMADVRGTGSSGGSWDSFGSREQRDGYELANWASSTARPWSNGNLGLWGASYMAINQFFTAAQHPKGLKAMFPIVPGGDVYRDVMASGGQIDVGFIPLWIGLVTATGLIPPNVATVAPDAALSVLLQHASGALGFQAPVMGNVALGSDLAYDGPFYRLRSPLSVIDKVDVPTFVVGGEYDLFQRGEPMLYDALRKRGVPSRLVIGPWTHVQAATASDLGGSGLGSTDELALRWFDHYVRGVADPALGTDVKPVTYYEQGSKKWRTLQSWAGSEIHAKAYDVGSTLKPVHGDTVAPNPVQGACSRSTDQWTAGLAKIPGCTDDNRVSDALSTSYQTEPLSKDLDIAGPIDADLSVSTTGTDGLLSVSVEDVAPDGSVSRLTGGWQTIALRATTRSKALTRNGLVLQPWHPYTKASEALVRPGQVVKVPVEIFPTGAKIATGHRLRLTVAAYDLPHLSPNLQQAVRGVAGVITVHHTAAEPSRLVLPVR